MAIVKNPSRRYWLITSPRTASNMLVKILNLDAQSVRPAFQGGYFFLKSTIIRFPLHDRPMKDWTADERAAVAQAQQEAYDTFQSHLSAAEQEGQTVFVKEHAVMLSHPYFETQHAFGPDAVSTNDSPAPLTPGSRSPLNLTSLPDEFLQTWHPTFLIRHPALMLPSLYRTRANQAAHATPDNPKLADHKEPLLPETTMKWIRTLYDFYVAHFASSSSESGDSSIWPIVLDADDIMTQPALVSKYASLTGLDPEKLRFSWQRASAEEVNRLPPMHRAMVGSIMASDKVDLSKVAGEVDIDVEAAKWREEFGEEVGRRLEGEVKGMMGDYWVMHGRRLRLD